MTNSTSTSRTVTSNGSVSICENTPIRSPGPPTAISTPVRSKDAERSQMASTVSTKACSAGSPATSKKTYMVVPSGDTRPDRWPMAASGLSTWATLSGALGPDSQAGISAAAAYAGGPKPADSRNTLKTGVPPDGKRSRASSYARVASASLGKNSACSCSLASPSPGSCEINRPAAMSQATSVTHLPQVLWSFPAQGPPKPTWGRRSSGIEWRGPCRWRRRP